MEILAIILAVALVVMAIMYVNLRNRTNAKPPVETIAEITKFRSIGELSVFQIYSKEIVTSRDKFFKGVLESILGWSVTDKQIAMIFEFEINFVYDLRSSEFNIERDGEKVKITMPPCKYKYFIKDMKIYDEKSTKILPSLIPDALNKLLGLSFTEEEKNHLIDKAKGEVKNMSVRIINELEGKIHKSAADTLEAIAKSFGASEVEFVFNDSGLIEDKSSPRLEEI